MFQTYAPIDLLTFLALEESLDQGVAIRSLDCEILTANILGRTFFSLFHDKHDLMMLALATVSQQDLSPEDSNDAVNSDHVYIRKLY